MENEMNVNETTVDINDVSTVETQQEDVELGCDLLCGTSIAFDVDEMDWGEIFNHIPEMEQNILTLKSMIFDLVRMPYPNGDSDEEVVQKTNRDMAADNAFSTANDFMKSVGVNDLSYDLRPNITSYDKALLICMDAILVQETIIGYARCEALANVNMDSMIDSMMTSDVTLTPDQLRELVESIGPIDVNIDNDAVKEEEGETT